VVLGSKRSRPGPARAQRTKLSEQKVPFPSSDILFTSFTRNVCYFGRPLRRRRRAWGITETGTDGDQPLAGLVRDKAGNLYGTAYNGGYTKTGLCFPSGCGVVFKLTP